MLMSATGIVLTVKRQVSFATSCSFVCLLARDVQA